jgi:hypothetical protein
MRVTARDAAPGAPTGDLAAAPNAGAPERPLANREFRGIIAAQVTSECGDQIAAIALSYLVYTRSNSAFLAAATYAVQYLPLTLGSVFLAPLVDRLSRRRVMLVADLARGAIAAALVVLASIHGISVGVLIGVVLVGSCFSPPYSAARSSMVPDLFDGGPTYLSAVAIGRILQQVDQVFGFALGGVIVAVVSPRGALAIDAVTFIVSFLITAREVRERPAVLAGARPTVSSLMREVGPTVAVVLASPSRRALLWLSGGGLLFLIAPESLAVAYAREHGHGAVAAGLLTASQPLGVAVGAWVFINLVPARRQGRWLLALAWTGGLLLTFTAFVPPIWLTFLLWMASGAMQSFLVVTIAAYNISTERSLRGRANGVAAAVIFIAQGLGFLVWGAVGSWRGAAAGVAWAGVVGLLIMSLIRYWWPTDDIAGAWRKLEATPRTT